MCQTGDTPGRETRFYNEFASFHGFLLHGKRVVDHAGQAFRSGRPIVMAVLLILGSPAVAKHTTLPSE